MNSQVVNKVQLAATALTKEQTDTRLPKAGKVRHNNFLFSSLQNSLFQLVSQMGG